MWAVVRDALNWSSNPQSVMSFRGEIRQTGERKYWVMWFLFYAICWTLWLSINDFIFNKNLISSPHVAVFRLILFLKHMVSTGEDIMALERQTDEIKSQMPEEMVTTLSGMILQAPSTRGSCFLGFLVQVESVS
jgi:hypothetical protein